MTYNLVNRKFLVNSSWMLFEKLSRVLLALIVGGLLARTLSIESFGDFSVALSLVAIVGVISKLGFDSSGVKFILTASNKSKVVSLMFTYKFIILCMSLILGVMFYLFTETRLSAYVTVLLLSMTLGSVFDVAEYIYIAQDEANIIARLRSSIMLFFMIFKALVLLIFNDLDYYLSLLVFEGLVLGIIFYHLLIKNVSNVKLVLKDNEYSILRSSLPLMLASLAGILYLKVDQFILLYFGGATDVAIYSVAMRLIETLSVLPMALSPILMSSLLKIEQGFGKARLYQTYVKVFGGVYIISVVFIGIIFLFGRYIINIIFGSGYDESVLLLRWLALSIPFNFLGILSQSWFIIFNKQVFTIRRTIIGLIVNIILNVLFYPIYGLVGVAIASVCAHIFAGLISDKMHVETIDLFKLKILRK